MVLKPRKDLEKSWNFGREWLSGNHELNFSCERTPCIDIYCLCDSALPALVSVVEVYCFEYSIVTALFTGLCTIHLSSRLLYRDMKLVRSCLMVRFKVLFMHVYNDKQHNLRYRRIQDLKLLCWFSFLFQWSSCLHSRSRQTSAFRSPAACERARPVIEDYYSHRRWDGASAMASVWYSAGTCHYVLELSSVEQKQFGSRSRVSAWIAGLFEIEMCCWRGSISEMT